jgi:hypothetical protein
MKRLWINKNKYFGIRIIYGNKILYSYRYEFSRLYFFIEWWRHVLEELKIIKKKYTQGEAWYTGWSTRLYFLKRKIEGVDKEDKWNWKWFLTGYKT